MSKVAAPEGVPPPPSLNDCRMNQVYMTLLEKTRLLTTGITQRLYVHAEVFPTKNIVYRYTFSFSFIFKMETIKVTSCLRPV